MSLHWVCLWPPASVKHHDVSSDNVTCDIDKTPASAEHQTPVSRAQGEM